VKLREKLNTDLKLFRTRQRDVYPRLSALDLEESELTTIQLPSYRMKYRQRSASETNPTDFWLRQTEIDLRCSQANSGVMAVRMASLALSAAKKARDDDYRGQAAITRSKRNVQKAELMKTFEITMYNHARIALVHLEFMDSDAASPYPLRVATCDAIAASQFLFLDITMEDVRLLIAEEEHAQAERGDSETNRPGAFILAGMEIEENQYVLCTRPILTMLIKTAQRKSTAGSKAAQPDFGPGG
jgi:hypothetical protein